MEKPFLEPPCKGSSRAGADRQEWLSFDVFRYAVIYLTAKDKGKLVEILVVLLCAPLYLCLVVNYRS